MFLSPMSPASVVIVIPFWPVSPMTMTMSYIASALELLTPGISDSCSHSSIPMSSPDPHLRASSPHHTCRSTSWRPSGPLRFHFLPSHLLPDSTLFLLSSENFQVACLNHVNHHLTQTLAITLSSCTPLDLLL